LTLSIIVILTCGLEVTQGQRICSFFPILRYVLNNNNVLNKRSLKMALFHSLSTVFYLCSFHSNYGCIFSHFWNIQRQKMACRWNMG